MKINNLRIYSFFLFALFFLSCENPIDNTQNEDDVEENCILDYGGFIDDCGNCVGGTTAIIPNSSEDVCGFCNGDNIIENVTLLFYDYDGDNIEDTLCGCEGEDVLNEDGCCGVDVRDNCGICGGDGADTDGDTICDVNEISGCDDITACNYNENATDDGECTYVDGICETCIEGNIVDNDVDDDGDCNDVDECNEATLPDGECDCEGSILDVCGVCGGDGFPDGTCNCDGDIQDCEGVCGGDAVDDCEGVCNGDSTLDECGVCDGNGIPENYCDCAGTLMYDCNQDCGGLAYYNYCGYCVGGNTGLINFHGQDDCGVCNGGNQNIDFCGVCFGGNIACTQGLLTLTEWELDETQIWNNEECAGPVNHSYDDYICIDEEGSTNCYDYEYEFSEDHSFIFKEYQWELGNDKDENPLIVNGEWSMDYTSYPIIINGNSLCLDFLDESETLLCFNSIELENDFSDCEQDQSICLDNNLTLTYINGSQCIVSRYTSK